MNGRERGFLLLGSCLGNPERKPLTAAQLRNLAMRAATMEKPISDRDLTEADLLAMGCSPEMAGRIVELFGEEQQLDWYLSRGKKAGCIPLTRVSDGYPVHLRKRLGLDSPSVLWAKGDVSLLQKPCIALVGSRDIFEKNAEFAARVGAEAALQGYVLVSGNARGADSIAQKACLNAGGKVISILADELEKRQPKENVLYLSEEDFDAPFTSVRALSRNRVIHALAEKAMVAQCNLGKGGTWSGTVRNLRENWSPVFCFRDGSKASLQLQQLGANLLETEDLTDLSALQNVNQTFF